MIKGDLNQKERGGVLVEAAIALSVLALIFMGLSDFLTFSNTHLSQLQINHELALTASRLESYSANMDRQSITPDEANLQPYYDWCIKKCTQYGPQTGGSPGVPNPRPNPYSMECKSVAAEPTSKPQLTCPDAILAFRARKMLNSTNSSQLKQGADLSTSVTGGNTVKITVRSVFSSIYKIFKMEKITTSASVDCTEKS